ncbi:energy-coupling factor transport system permease protein [Kribbella voronezhensis]|uniref:Energy-coupling factor transport system permease protein n=1 Tax=Kribbella voronezhensis TaxID=2512212 RepID=A0A4R7T5J0_9ACTN|nr:energy-coupling factor transporter transmembrane component T [Kribbella voronezhensis]TDU87131.1 energy-coupling factor transport system permease protein [Kribbella voronezhensis]
MRAVHHLTLPRALHPGAWWLWALGLAVAASRTRNPVLLVLILAVAGFVVAARRSDAPWANSYVAFLKLGLVVIGLRIVLQALLSTRSQGNTVLFTLPQIPLPDWANGVKLGGEVTAEALLTALYDGGQLAVMLCCIGAANALASPRRLLKSLPGALYEMGVACVVALTFAPQLVTDARRIRGARRLRGRTRGSFRTTAMPVLEGALDRSVELAAAMDSRGYGRTAQVPRRQRRITGGSVLLGLLGIALGVYSLLTDAMAFPVAAAALTIGLLLAVAAMAVGRQRVTRTRYRPDPWALPEWLVTAAGAAAAATMIVAAARGVNGLVLAGPLVVPPVPVVPVIGLLIGLAPAFAAPPLTRRVELVPA